MEAEKTIVHESEQRRLKLYDHVSRLEEGKLHQAVQQTGGRRLLTVWDCDVKSQ